LIIIEYKEMKIKFRKTKIIVVIACVLFLHYTASAQENTHNSLWRVSEGKNSVYLLGSIHMMKNETRFLNDSINRAFDDSKVLVLEVDLNSMADPRIQQILIAKGILAGGESFEKLIRKETYARLRKKAAELGLDISKYHQYKPWFFMLMLAETKLQMLGYNPQQGIDRHFFARAAKCGKQVIGLETPEQQMEMLDTMSKLDQDRLVRHGIKDLEIIEEELDSIINAWSTGDMEGLERTILKSFKGFPEIYNTLIINRNKDWIPKIESFLKQKQNYMIIVGAAHLPGRHGLVELLKKNGRLVEQL